MCREAVVAVILIVAVVSTGCTKDPGPPQDQRLVIVTTLFPLYDFARQVGGDNVEVRLLLPPGVEPHSFEPRPADMITVTRSDIFVYTGDFMEPWAADLLRGLGGQGPVVVDAGKGIALRREGSDHDHAHGRHGKAKETPDPHIWLDFGNAMKMASRISEAIASKDPVRRDTYLENTRVYLGSLKALDDEYRDALSHCRQRVIVHGGHFAFNYLAARYGLEYVSAYRGGGETEPSPRDVAAIVGLLRARGLQHVFYEELVSPRLSETIAREVGGSLLKLHGAHNVTRDEMKRGVTFISLMQDNLVSLRTGLQCR